VMFRLRGEAHPSLLDVKEGVGMRPSFVDVVFVLVMKNRL
jgi:hypothetical protein